MVGVIWKPKQSNYNMTCGGNKNKMSEFLVKIRKHFLIQDTAQSSIKTRDFSSLLLGIRKLSLHTCKCVKFTAHEIGFVTLALYNLDKMGFCHFWVNYIGKCLYFQTK